MDPTVVASVTIIATPSNEEPPVRYVQAAILLIFLGAVGLFALQNMQSVTVDFATWSISAPVALLAVAVYLLGMLTGWTVVAFVRRSIHRVSEPPHRED